MIVRFSSKNNQVWLIQCGRQKWVRKIFENAEKAAFEAKLLYCFDRERLIAQHGACLDMKFVRGIRLDRWIEQREKAGTLDWDAGKALVYCLSEFKNTTGLVCTDHNLRNFIVTAHEITRIDFESAKSGELNDSLASLCAYILLNRPEDSAVKRRIVQQIKMALALNEMETDIFENAICRNRKEILKRRKHAA